MIGICLHVLKRSTKTLLLIGAFAALGAGVLTLGVGMDTPWAPWERQSDTMFPPLFVHIGEFRGYGCFLCNDGSFPHSPENSDR